MRVLVLGAGYSGKAIGAAFKSQGAEVFGTTRSEAKMPALQALGITPLLFDGADLSDELGAVMGTATHLVQSIAPGRDGDPLFRPGLPAVADLMPALEWAAYLSTVGVYGDHKGGWVDEDTPCHPVSDRSVERVMAEDSWLAFGAEQDLPVAVLRLSGIYGPGRNAFRNLENGTARRLIKKDQVFNRIRVEDIAASSMFLAKRKTGGIFNITDQEPAPPQDVVSEAARLMGVEPPAETQFETADLSPMARSFYGENKRVSNHKIRDLGFEFRFPDYRISLEHLWTSQRF
ncbi:SDR family oxidoreductase [Pararhizobium sp.]|uniref:SDR family oxidoreductase n=1 Tax=Pararhizobium sp. TaxID=1977563 RepID=UPI0027217CEA|nr:SDR family oxidoreductase [Pararhizobium sp.]MDO9417665.1 SDR family oxidoreductase [Pararhizobium sp.]